MTDFIYTITVDLTGEGEGEFVTEKNYKEIIRDLEGLISISEKDNDILDERMETLAENWYEKEPKTKEAWNAMEKEWDKYKEQIEDNKEFIKKCEKTIRIIEFIAEEREWE